MDIVPNIDYYRRLESFAFNLGIVGIPLSIWLLIVFITNKSFSKFPHKITGFLMISQVLLFFLFCNLKLIYFLYVFLSFRITFFN